MINKIIVTLGVAVLLALSQGINAAEEIAEVEEAKLAAYREAIKAFGTELRGELQAGMQSGGPVAAVGICQSKATEIATKHSKEKGWKITRVTTKSRNPSSKPDAWEETVLASFEQRKAGGEAMDKMEYGRIVKDGDTCQVRYMKAIAAQEVCMACHGEQLRPDVSAKVKELYPEDKATGYKVGDLRGAFSVSEAVSGTCPK
jgi:hypothetical protein